MDQAGPVVLVVGGIFLFLIALSVLKAVMSRGIDKVFDFGMRKVEKATMAGLESAIAVPMVLKSAASPEEIMAVLDQVVFASKGKPGLGAVVYESARTAERVEYSMGNQFYAQQFVAEVRFSERDGMTQAVFKCLHITERNGMHVGAGPLMALRESVEYAVGAVGDPVRIAEGARLYGTPEPGSPRAIRIRNKKYLTWAAIPLVLIPLFTLRKGWGDGGLLMGAMLLAGLVCAFLVWRMDLRPGQDRAKEFPADGTPGPSVLPEGVATAVTAVGGVAGEVGANWKSLSSNNKLVLAGAILAALVVGGLTVSWIQAWQDQASGLRSDAEIEALAAAHEAADAANVDSESSDEPLTTDGTESDSYSSAGDESSWHFVPDIMQYGPSTGESRYASVTFVETPDRNDLVSMLIDSVTVGAPGYDEIWTIRMSSDEFGSPAVCYIDEAAVSVEEFVDFVTSNPGTAGSIYFTDQGIATFKAYHAGEVPSDYVPPEGGDI